MYRERPVTIDTDQPGSEPFRPPTGPSMSGPITSGRPPMTDDPTTDSDLVTDDHDAVDSDPVAERRRGEPTSGARAFFDWIVVVAIALSVAFLVRGFLLAHFVVDGTSMATTLAEGDRVFVNKLSYRLHDPNRGDVVVLHQINGRTERDLIKRVIALPGETVEMVDCVVRITEVGAATPRVLDEPYLDPEVVTPDRCGSQFGPEVVPDGEVFVMGDNRAGSQDSRALGTIPEEDLVGRAFVVFWPRSSWQWL